MIVVSWCTAIFSPQLSLFFDILLPMTTAVSEKDFVQGERSGTFGKPGSGDSAESRLNMTMARKLLWKELHEYRLKACEEFFAIYIYNSKHRFDILQSTHLCVGEDKL